MNLSKGLLSRFSRLALANSLSNVTIPLASLVDAGFLGHLTELHHLAGVALSAVLFNFLYYVVKCLRLGTTGLTAQAEARLDRDTVLIILARNSIIALIVGVFILLLQQPIRAIGFAFLSGTPSVLNSGIDYYNTRIWGAPAVLINYVLIGWFMGREKGGIVLALSLVANGGNILLDYLLIGVWNYESAGAGIATAASQYLMLFVGLGIIIFENWLTKIPLIARRIFDINGFKTAIQLNTDLFFARLAFIVTCSLFIAISSSFGILILTANSLLIEAIYLIANFIDGLSFATESLAGSFRGSGENEKLFPLLMLTGGTSLSIGLISALTLIIIPDPLFGILTNHREAIAQIHHYLFWLLPILGCWCLAISLNGYFLGLTQGKLIRNSMAIATIVGFLPEAIAAWKLQNVQMLWLALFLFLVVRTIILFLQVPKSFLAPAKII